MGLSYAQQYPVVALTGFLRSVGSLFALLNSFPPGENYPPAAQLFFYLVPSWFVTCTVWVEFWWIVRHATLLTRSVPLRLLILFLGMFTLLLSGVALVSAVIRGSKGVAIGLHSFNVVLNVVYNVVLLRFYYQFFTPKKYFGYGPEAIPRASEPQAGDVEQEYRDEEDGDVVNGPLYQLYKTLQVASVPPVDLDQNENEGTDLLLDAEVDVVASDQPANHRSPPGPSWRPEREASCQQQASYESQVLPEATGQTSRAAGECSETVGETSKNAGENSTDAGASSANAGQASHNPRGTSKSAATEDNDASSQHSLHPDDSPSFVIQFRRSPLDPNHISLRGLVITSIGLIASSGYELIFYGIVPVATSSPNKQAPFMIAMPTYDITFVILTWIRLFRRRPQGFWASAFAGFLAVLAVTLNLVGFCIWLARQTGLDYAANRDHQVLMWLLMLVRLFVGGLQMIACLCLIFDCWS